MSQPKFALCASWPDKDQALHDVETGLRLAISEMYALRGRSWARVSRERRRAAQPGGVPESAMTGVVAPKCCIGQIKFDVAHAFRGCRSPLWRPLLQESQHLYVGREDIRREGW